MARTLAPEHSMYQTTCPHSTNHLQHHSTKGQCETLYGSITLPFKYPSSRNILPFCNYTSNDTLSSIHWKVFSTVWYVNAFIAFHNQHIFFDISHSFPSPLHLHLVPQSYSRSNLVHANIPGPFDIILVIPLPSSLNHSPDLGCVGAQKIIFLGRLFV